MYVRMDSTPTMLHALVLIVQIVKTSCIAQTIHCTQDLNYLKFEDSNSTLSILNTRLTLFLMDDFKFYAKNESYTEIFVPRVQAIVVGDMLLTYWTPPTTYFRPAKRLQYNYELHGFIKKVPQNSKSCERDSLRVLLKPLPTGKMSSTLEPLKNRTQMEVEVCIERYLRNKLTVKSQTPSYKGCSSRGSYYMLLLKKFFQDVINRIADKVVHIIIIVLLDPIEGKIPAPKLSINFTKLLVSGTFTVFNGTLSDLRTIRRRSNITVSLDNQLLVLSGSFHIKTIKVLYNDYNITGVPLLSGGHNVTITFNDGVIADVIIHVDIKTLPCGIQVHSLRLSSEGEVNIEAADAFNVVESTIKSEFASRKDAILQQFADRLREYIEIQRNEYICNTERLAGFLEKTLNRTNYVNA